VPGNQLSNLIFLLFWKSHFCLFKTNKIFLQFYLEVRDRQSQKLLIWASVYFGILDKYCRLNCFSQNWWFQNSARCFFFKLCIDILTACSKCTGGPRYPRSLYLQIHEYKISLKCHISGADAMNISGLLVEESRLLNPKKLGNFKNWML